MYKQGQYPKLFLAGLINGIGDRFNQVAILSFILLLTNSGLAIGAALAIRILPYLIFSPYGGWVASRFMKKHVLVATDVIRIFVALSFLFVKGEGELFLIYVLLFLLAAGEAVYQPVRKSLLLELVKEEDLYKVNRLEQVLLGSVLVFGSALGGIISYVFSPQLVFIINGFTFLVAGLILSSISTYSAEIQSAKETIFANIGRGIRTLKKSKTLLGLFTLNMLIPLVDGVFNVLISVYAFQRFGLNDMGIGIFYGALGGGLVLSMLLKIPRSSYLVPLGLLALLVEGVFQLFLAQDVSFILAILLFSFVSFCSGVGNASFDTVLMERTPRDSYEPIFALFELVSNVVMGIAMLGAGFLLTYLPSEDIGFWTGGMLIVISFVAILLILINSLKLRYEKDITQTYKNNS